MLTEGRKKALLSKQAYSHSHTKEMDVATASGAGVGGEGTTPYARHCPKVFLLIASFRHEGRGADTLFRLSVEENDRL